MRLFILLFSISLIVGCRKTKFESGEKWLPRATEKGRGIFACYIGDKTYKARRQESIVYNAQTGYLFLENSYHTFEFRLFVYEGLFSEGEYAFHNTGEEWVGIDFDNRYGIEEDGINELIVTRLDVEERIIAGRFNIDLIDENGNEKLIRDGRFDLEMSVID